jgi:pilus assembly protein Flp/PilA
MLKALCPSLKKLVKDKSGATAIEYALIAGLIGVVIIGGATTLGNNVRTKMTNTGANVLAAGGAANR